MGSYRYGLVDLTALLKEVKAQLEKLEMAVTGVIPVVEKCIAKLIFSRYNYVVLVCLSFEEMEELIVGMMTVLRSDVGVSGNMVILGATACST